MNGHSRFTFLVFLVVSLSTLGHGQLKTGLDVYSRYIWRGVDYGNAPSVQPAISFTTGGFSVGSWGAYSVGSSGTDTMTGSARVFAEHDLWASYGVTTPLGTFSALFTDYFYPSSGLKFFDYGDTGGAHVLEVGASYAGTESFPVVVAAYYNFRNDADRSVYLHVSYPFSFDSGTLTLFAAGTPSQSAWYVTTDAALINAGLSFSKAIKMTDAYSLPVTASYIINPHLEQSYLTFGISL